MKVALTGSTGFIGRFLAHDLIGRDVKVIHIGRSRERVQARFGENAIFIDAEIATQEIRERLLIHSPQVVIHCATFFSPDRNLQTAELAVQSNLDFPIKVFESAKDIAATFINLNSFWQLDSSELRSTPYAASKGAFRAYINAASTAQRQKVKNIFLPETFGPLDKRGKVMQLLIESALRKDALKLVNPQKKINLAYVPYFSRYLSSALRADDELPNEFAYVNFPSVRLSDLQKEVENHITGARGCVDLSVSDLPEHELIERDDNQITMRSMGLEESSSLALAIAETLESYRKQ